MSGHDSGTFVCFDADAMQPCSFRPRNIDKMSNVSTLSLLPASHAGSIDKLNRMLYHKSHTQLGEPTRCLLQHKKGCNRCFDDPAVLEPVNGCVQHIQLNHQLEVPTSNLPTSNQPKSLTTALPSHTYLGCSGGLTLYCPIALPLTCDSFKGTGSVKMHVCSLHVMFFHVF